MMFRYLLWGREIHPDDAEARGLRSGDTARLRTRVGELEAPVEVTRDVMPGVVSLPHGFGHDAPGANLTVAREKQPGVNSNVLTDETGLDALSCNAVLNGIPVEIEPAPESETPTAVPPDTVAAIPTVSA